MYKPSVEKQIVEKGEEAEKAAKETFSRMSVSRFEAHFFQIWGKTLMKKDCKEKRATAFDILNTWWTDNAADCDFSSVLRVVRESVADHLKKT